MSQFVRPARERNLGPDHKREEMIVAHLPQIRCIARLMSTKLPPHVDLNDLEGAAVIGLLDAAARYDAGRGVSFKTYAEQRIRGAVLDSLREQDWAPRVLRQKLRAVEKAVCRIERRLGREPVDLEICEELGITLAELHRLWSAARALTPVSFEEYASHSAEGELEPQPIPCWPSPARPDPFAVIEEEEVRALLARAIAALPKRERLVLSLYYYDELPMREIARILGVNESRVSQQHGAALRRLRAKLKSLRGTQPSEQLPM
jgi:RNA polymerase sigma factor for flagellar operon FliA